ncbi:MAG: hypothetical protein WAL56_16980 [Candidatus Sulfotelmatobacter sp.]
MSTSAVSSASLNQQFQSYFQTRNSDVQQLGKALSSGNLEQAQVAYNNITAVGQGGPLANGNSFRVPQREQDFQAIGQALQSGNLAGAQSAFAALKATAKGAGETPPWTAGGGETPPSTASEPPSSTPEVVLNLTNTGTSTNPEQITLNIGPSSSSGGEQVSISVGNQGSTPQQVSFNLGANSNEQIVINLLAASATAAASTAAATGSTSGLSVSA